MFKKYFTNIVIILLISTSNLFSCWFTNENFENLYLAGVNYFVKHYINQTDGSFSTAKYINGPIENNMVNSYYSVSLPLTVWVKISPRVVYVNNIKNVYNIRRAELYYKIIPNNDSSLTRNFLLETCRKH